TRFSRDWSSDVCSSDLKALEHGIKNVARHARSIIVNRNDNLCAFPLNAKRNSRAFRRIICSVGKKVEQYLTHTSRVCLECVYIRSEERRVGKGRRTR